MENKIKIVIAFPGAGKSFLSKKYNCFVDIGSINFSSSIILNRKKIYLCDYFLNKEKIYFCNYLGDEFKKMYSEDKYNIVFLENKKVYKEIIKRIKNRTLKKSLLNFPLYKENLSTFFLKKMLKDVRKKNLLFLKNNNIHFNTINLDNKNLNSLDLELLKYFGKNNENRINYKI